MINGILDVARNKIADVATIDELVIMTKYSSGKYFMRAVGVSISDFAFAALKWIGSQYSIECFEAHFNKLPDERKTRINKIISEYPL